MNQRNQTLPAFRRLETLEDFAKELSNEFNSYQLVRLQQNVTYLFDYLLKGLKVQTWLCEEFYFSQSYFDDYKFYHINSYKDLLQ